MSGLNLLFGFRLHWGLPTSRAEARFITGWSSRTRKDTGVRETRPHGVVHELRRFVGLSRRRSWFAGVMVFGETVGIDAADVRALNPYWPDAPSSPGHLDEATTHSGGAR